MKFSQLFKGNPILKYYSHKFNKFEAIDIETRFIDNKHVPFYIAFTKNHRTLSYFNWNPLLVTKSMLEYLDSNKIYYFHNLRYDFRVLNEYLIKLGCTVEGRMGTFDNPNLYRVSIKYRNDEFILLDSLKLLPFKLETLSKSFLGEDLKIPFPYEFLHSQNIKEYKFYEVDKNHFNDFNEYYKFIEMFGYEVNLLKVTDKYVKRDVEVLKACLCVFFETLDSLGYTVKFSKVNMKLTIPSIAIDVYYSLFDNEKVKNVNRYSDTFFSSIVRNGYFGGRTEVFGNASKNEKVLHYDFSGMYAQCMKENIPSGEYFIDYPRDTLKPGFYFIKVYVDKDLKIPVLPLKTDKTIFPTGTIEGIYWYEEINLLLEVSEFSKIIEIYYRVGFTKYDTFFKDFIDFNNEIRKKGGPYNQIGKLLNNSFYGKWGQKAENRSRLAISADLLKENDRIINENENSLDVERHTTRKKYFGNIMIAAAITSKARIKLYRGFMEVQEIGGRLLYCDTDSIFAAFPKDSYRNYLNKSFGEIIFDSNNDDTILQKSLFLRPKEYGVVYEDGQENVKIKGIPRNYINFSSLESTFLSKSKLMIDVRQWMMGNDGVYFREIQKNIDIHSYDKRIWIKRYKDTKPLYFKEYSPLYEFIEVFNEYILYKINLFDLEYLNNYLNFYLKTKENELKTELMVSILSNFIRIMTKYSLYFMVKSVHFGIIKDDKYFLAFSKHVQNQSISSTDIEKFYLQNNIIGSELKKTDLKELETTINFNIGGKVVSVEFFTQNQFHRGLFEFINSVKDKSNIEKMQLAFFFKKGVKFDVMKISYSKQYKK